MKKLCYILLFMAFTANSQSVTLDELLAFPGAVGWARSERGFASTPTFRYVTNLNNSGSGSLRDACSSAGPAVVYFMLSGKIIIDSPITVPQNVYIAGQTAYYNGGEGIVLEPSGSFSGDAPLIGTNDQLIRFIDVWGGTPDCYLTQYPAGGSNIYVDHCSFYYGEDENVDFYATTESTFAYNIVGECVNGSGFGRGMIFSAGADKVTMYANIFTNNHQRNPLIGGDSNTGDEFEFINNYIFNPGGWGLEVRNNSGGANVKINLIGNRVHRANSSSGSRYLFVLNEDGANDFYVDDNKDDLFRTSDGQDQADAFGDANDLASEVNNTYITGTPFNYPMQSNGTIYDVDDLRAEVVDYAGTYLNRKSLDQAQLDYIDANTGLSSYRTNRPTTPSVGAMSSTPLDANTDGVFDDFISSWTITNNAGYAPWELFLAELAEDLQRAGGSIGSGGVPVPATSEQKLLSARRRN